MLSVCAGMYNSYAYTLAQFTIELSYILFQTVIYSAITYSMIQFEWTAAKFFWRAARPRYLFGFQGCWCTHISERKLLAFYASDPLPTVL